MPFPRRPAAPSGPPSLSAARLRQAQTATLASPRLRYAPASRLLFAVVDLLHGPRRSLVKFAMLELIARVPLPGVGERDLRHAHPPHRRGALARRVFDRLVKSRSQQDNEQWHLLTLNDLATRAEAKRSVLRHRVIPQLIAMAYCHLAWLLFVVKPAWSYRLNAHFEDHALTRVHALRRRTPNWSTNPTRAPSPPTTGATPAWPTCSARSDTTSAPTNRKPRAAHLRLPGAPSELD